MYHYINIYVYYMFKNSKDSNARSSLTDMRSEVTQIPKPTWPTSACVPLWYPI